MSTWDTLGDSAGTFTDGVKELTQLNLREGVADVGLGYTRLIVTAGIGAAAMGLLYMIPVAGNPVRMLVSTIDGALTKVADVVRG